MEDTLDEAKRKFKETFEGSRERLSGLKVSRDL
jgi:hypothetical protein